MSRERMRGGIALGVLVALLATPLILREFETRQARADEGIDREAAMERYGFHLDEISGEMGIDFVHQGPQLDPALDHILPQIASIGASASIVDVNRNGLPDLYLTNSRHGTMNALYLNQGDGTFVDRAAELGIADVNREGTGVSMGAIWGDYNNSGYEDLFIYKWGKPELFRNDGEEGFTRVTEEAGLPEWVNANTAIWLDFNGNGLLDLYMAGYYDERLDLWALETTRIMPESYEYARNGGRNYLLQNMGDGTFRDVTEAMGVESRRWALAVAAADLTGNGYPDIFLANDYGVDELFINENGEGFRSAGESAGIGFQPKSGMSVAFADLLNRGESSIYITNIAEPGVLMQGNNLWVPSGRSSGDTPRFSNLAGNFGVELGGWGYAGQFGDLNNSGFQDLYVANGFVSDEPATDYWYDFTKVVGGNQAIIQDAANWPPMNGRSLAGYQQNRLWINDGAGRFREVSAAVGGRLDLDSRAVAMADLFDQGALDIVVASQNGPVQIYRTEVTPEHHWIGFELEGSRSNRSAIGARVEVHWNGQQQVQFVYGGNAFASQNQRPLHFGLGPTREVDRVVIRWPSGAETVVEQPEVNRRHQIREPDGATDD